MVMIVVVRIVGKPSLSFVGVFRDVVVVGESSPYVSFIVDDMECAFVVGVGLYVGCASLVALWSFSWQVPLHGP